MIKVSIIVPVYNVEKYLRICLDSLISQTLSDIEIILIDDDSTDNSGRICDEYVQRDSRVKVFHKKNEGLGLTRNYGIHIAQGEYIGFVDSDDFVDETMFEILYNAAIEGEYNAVYCANNYRYISNGNIINPLKTIFEDCEYLSKEDVTNKLLPDIISSPANYRSDGVIGVSVWKAIYNRKLINDNNILFYSERKYISEDAIFQLEFLSVANKVKVIPNTLYYYRENDNSLSMKYKANRFEMYKVLYYKQLELVEKFDNKPILNERIERIYLANVRLCLIQEVQNDKLNFRSKINNISRINNDLLTQRVLRDYPIKLLPTNKKVVCILQKYKLNFLIYILIRIYNER